MSKEGYLIGDVSQLAGVSRDTLRFYEKKGIISSTKQENGYRSYSYDDIIRLSNILYSRKMNFTLEDIEGLWRGDSTYQSIESVAKRMIDKEKEITRLHNQVLTRLRMTVAECRRIGKNLNRISQVPFPSAYVIRRCNSSQEGLQEWFQLSAAHDGMDMIYTYDSYRYDKSGLIPGESLLLFDRQAAHKLLEGVDFTHFSQTAGIDCIHTIVETEECAPPLKMAEHMMRWGRRRGLSVSGRIYSSLRLQTGRNGKSIYYLKLYMPLEVKAPRSEGN